MTLVQILIISATFVVVVLTINAFVNGIVLGLPLAVKLRSENDYPDGR
jgi:hypothetical protein